jgi:protein O-GlcNAc transferase
MKNSESQHTTLIMDESLRQAIAHHRAGRLQEAEGLYRMILQEQPKHSDANHNLGILAMQVKQNAAALDYFKTALEANPNQVQYWLSYIEALIQTGLTDAARDLIEQGRRRGLHGEAVDALSKRLKHPSSDEIDILISLFNQGRYTEVETAARRMTELFPQYGLGWKVLGAALKMLRKDPEALQAGLKAVLLLPNDAEAYNNLGNLFQEKGRFSEAEAYYHRALEIKPDYAQVYYNLGNALREQGRLKDAEISCRRAVTIRPDYAEAHYMLANTLQLQDRSAEAETCYRRSIEIMPNCSEVHNNLGNTLRELGRIMEAEACYRRSLEIKPDFAEVLNNLGVTLKEQGRLEDAKSCYLRALEIKPDRADVYSNWLFALNYTDNHTPLSCLKQARHYGHMMAKKAVNVFSSWQCDAKPKRLRVGFVSGDFWDHAVCYFLEDVLMQFRSTHIEPIAYPSYRKTDSMTARIRPCFSKWNPVFGLTDEAAARLIHDDGVHILIDLSGHTANNRLPLFAYKPAPIQVTWLGYFATTGINEMDYILADEVGVPSKNRKYFVEKVRYLPDTRLCFSTPRHDIAVSPLPASVKGCITFGCFQNTSKVTDALLETWKTILARLPTARLRFQSKQLRDERYAESYYARLASRGIDPHRVDLQGASLRKDYLSAYSQVDIVLDTFPYPGGTTTCEALWMGVPTLTLAGNTLLARQGASLLSAAGLWDWIADDLNCYIEKAVMFASDLTKLAELRTGLRKKVLASPLFDAQRFTRNFENALWKMWDDYQASVQSS